MPNYNTSPFGNQPALIYPGVPYYLFGSWPQDQSPTLMYVTSVAIASNVATVGVQIYGGAIPVVGALISIVGTATLSGAFNVTNVALTGVTIATTGVGTVTFALTGTNTSTTPDGGQAIVPQPEVGETISTVASVAVTPKQDSEISLDRTVTVQTNYTTVPTASTVTLQGSMTNLDADYVSIATAATVSGSAVTLGFLTVVSSFLFYRVLPSGLSGTGKYVVKIAVG
jgi:hypothetical protein